MKWLKRYDADFVGFSIGGVTKLFRVPGFLRKEPEFKLEPVAPATDYTLSLLGALAAKGVSRVTFRQSEALPVLEAADLGGSRTDPLLPVAFAEVENVFKVHAGLNPVRFPDPTTGRTHGSIQFAFPKAMDVSWTACFCDDADPHFTLELAVTPRIPQD